MCLREHVESKVNTCVAVKAAKSKGVKDTNSGVPEAELWVALCSLDKAYPFKVLGGHMASNILQPSLRLSRSCFDCSMRFESTSGLGHL